MKNHEHEFSRAGKVFRYCWCGVENQDWRFDGETYNAPRDADRLTGQHGRVWDLMHDGEWRTLAAIAKATGDPEASVSARLRDLRKPRFGAHVVERRYTVNGLHEYRLIVKVTA